MTGPHFRPTIPDGDHKERQVCGSCGFIFYENPKLVAGAVVTWQSPEGETLFLLCRRAIEPRRGYWTLPAGFIEERESPADGARREAMEEACCEIAIDGLLGIYTVTHISQVLFFFEARLERAVFACGSESLEVQLFRWAEIPWDELAFESVPWALDCWRRAREGTASAPFFHPLL